MPDKLFSYAVEAAKNGDMELFVWGDQTDGLRVADWFVGNVGAAPIHDDGHADQLRQRQGEEQQPVEFLSALSLAQLEALQTQGEM